MRNSSPHNHKAPVRVLFFVWGGIGNMVMALPAIDSAIGRNAQRKVMVAAQKPEMLELLYGRDLAGRLVVGSLDSLREILRFRPQAAINTVPSPRLRGGLWALLSGAGIRISPRQYAGPFINHPLSASGGHFSQMNHDLLPPLGIRERAEYSRLMINPAWDRPAEDLLRQLNIGAQHKLVGLHPGAGQAMKRWPLDNFAEVGRQLAKMGYRVIVLGGPEEVALAAEVARQIGSGAVSAAGRSGLGLVLALISRCRVVISNDSGLAHCSAALGVPTMTVFGPTDPEKCAPLGLRATFVRSNRSCAPCYRPPGFYGCRECPPPCLDIPPERVVNEVDILTKKNE